MCTVLGLEQFIVRLDTAPCSIRRVIYGHDNSIRTVSVIGQGFRCPASGVVSTRFLARRADPRGFFLREVVIRKLVNVSFLIFGRISSEMPLFRFFPGLPE